MCFCLDSAFLGVDFQHPASGIQACIRFLQMTGPEVNQAFDKAFWDERAKAKAPVEERNVLGFTGSQ